MGIIATKGDGGKDFEPCPEYMGRAVCVDVTPLREYQTQYGAKQQMKIVFEIDLIDESRKPAQPWVVFSRPFTPSLGEKAALAKFLKDWFGRKLTDAEASSFDLDTLIGRPAFLMIAHEEADGGAKVYANIKGVGPHKQGEALKPSGKWVRLQDRPAKDGQGGGGSSYRRAPGGGGGGAGAEDTGTDPSKTKVHVGKNKGLELRELTEEAIAALITHWLPAAKTAEKQSADDKRLMKALDWYQAEMAAREAAAQKVEEDDIPY